MKKIICSLLVMLAALPMFAQDVIVTKTGDEIQSKVLKISDSEVEYKKWDNQDDPTFVMSVDKAFMIKYQSGDKEVFEKKQVAKVDTNVIANTTVNAKKTKKFRTNINIGYTSQCLKWTKSGERLSWGGDKAFSSGLMFGLSWDFDIKNGIGIEFCDFGMELFRENSSGSGVYEEDDFSLPYTYDIKFSGIDLFLSPIKFQYRSQIGNWALYVLTGPTFDFALSHTYSVTVYAEGQSDHFTQTFKAGEGELKNSVYLDWDLKFAVSYKFVKIQVGTSLGVNSISQNSNNRVVVKRPLYVILSFVI